MITNKEVQDAIASIEHYKLRFSSSVVCALTLTNGHVVIGEAHCAPGTEFDPALGQEYSRQDAEEKVRVLLAFAHRSQFKVNPLASGASRGH